MERTRCIEKVRRNLDCEFFNVADEENVGDQQEFFFFLRPCKGRLCFLTTSKTGWPAVAVLLSLQVWLRMMVKSVRFSEP